MKAKSRRVAKKQVKKLIQSTEWKISSELAKRLSPKSYIETIYQNSDGHILEVLRDGVGHLYTSHQDWDDFMSYIQSLSSESQAPQHILAGRLPHGQQFPQISDELANKLHLQLNLNKTQLNGNIDSVCTLEQAIYQVGQSKCLNPDLFEPLLAYIGKVVRSLSPQSYWEMRNVEAFGDEAIWEPWLVTLQDSFPIFIWLYDELYEEEVASIQGIVNKFSAQ